MYTFGSPELADMLRPMTQGDTKQPSVSLKMFQPEYIKKAENLFKKSNRLMLVPVLFVDDMARSCMNLIVMDRSDWKSQDFFQIPLSGGFPNYLSITRGSVPESICPHIATGTKNWDTTMAFSYMLTLCGYDVYLFSIESKEELKRQIDAGQIHDFKPELFSPLAPPGMVFVMTEKEFYSTFEIAQ